MSIARVAEPSGSLQEAKEWGLDREDLLGIYRNMLLTRGVEERGHILYRQGKIPGSFYTGRGNEASSVAIATAMAPRRRRARRFTATSACTSTRGVEPWRILANYMGRVDGPAKGTRRERPHGGPDTSGSSRWSRTCPRCSRSRSAARSPSASARRSRVAVAWFGEGSSARGDAHEGMNFAAVRQLPVVFICDNNQWAYSTPTHLEYAVEHLADRAAGYGFEGRRRRRHRHARRLPRGQARDREGARRAAGRR